MRLSGRERAYDFVKNQLLTDPQVQGTFINEQVVADQLGVSRTPIREALLMLAAQQLVELVPKRGAYVAPMSGRELTELVEARGVIERHAAAFAHHEGPVAEMRDALAAQHLLRSAGQAREFIEADTRFHDALVRSTGNDILTKTYEGLRDRQNRAGRIALANVPGRQDGVLTEHSAILAALVEQDVERARQAIDVHLRETLRIQLMS
ncbi:GntR family transcriptional regulator [Kibdelosporangium phytohabitans]|uniref:GntR family transcriptional regulator n=1 Tax=Kibdelosporangium phytohabitans TaxID=860235 RepID=A0A0N9HNJ1_9PSEU|nr:GntR family transcriptional regulator [Kibdelosporangium phytohabitans]ALG05816.1 GntR family transcriptional regulator [Kibdelosporangium phytohabitans]MBE1466166.1 DNA-binding GntR family transcriptional regulator [Kibdelosporangium phytohabitans]